MYISSSQSKFFIISIEENAINNICFAILQHFSLNERDFKTFAVNSEKKLWDSATEINLNKFHLFSHSHSKKRTSAEKASER